MPTGPPPGSCIDTGPFAGLMHNVGPGFQLETANPHCLIRNIQTDLADDTLQWKADVMPVLALTDYFNMSFAMSVPTTGKPRGIHGGGHSGVNGEVCIPLHHGFCISMFVLTYPRCKMSGPR